MEPEDRMRTFGTTLYVMIMIAFVGCGRSNKNATALPRDSARTAATSQPAVGERISAHDSTSSDTSPAIDTTGLLTPSKVDTFAINLPVQVLMTSDGMSGDSLFKDQYPESTKVVAQHQLASQIGAYGAAYKIWIGPNGWTGQAGAGVDGTVSAYLYPLGGSDSAGPRINYYVIPACGGCILSAAALYFSNAMNEWNVEYNKDGKVPIKIPPGLKVTKLSPTLVLYSLPDIHGLTVGGVAYYDSGGEESDASFLSAQFTMPAKDSVLTRFLLKTFLEREGLK
jgi:Domain of unknown function (DUF4850)